VGSLLSCNLKMQKGVGQKNNLVGAMMKVKVMIVVLMKDKKLTKGQEMNKMNLRKSRRG